MKPTSLVFVLIALFCTVGVASAAVRLKSIMQNWKADAATAERILAGGGSFDETEMNRILQSFITDSQEIEARASGSSAQAKDIKGRFANFEFGREVGARGNRRQGSVSEALRSVAWRLSFLPQRVRELARSTAPVQGQRLNGGRTATAGV